MKHLLLLTLMTLGFMYSNAQSVSNEIVANPLIFEFYPKTKVEIMLKESPQEILFWNAIYEYGYEVKSIADSEKNLAEKYKEIEIKDIENVNILGLNLFPKKGIIQYFKIKGTDKVLILKSEESIRKQLSKEK